MTDFRFRMSRKGLVIFLSVLFLAACGAQAQHQVLPVKTFEQGMAQPKAQLLDVRTLEEYNSGHLKQALQADWNQPSTFQERIRSLDKQQPVYVYCLSGARSRAAANRLKEEGFSTVYQLEGGIMAWKQANRPVEALVRVKLISLPEYRAMIPAKETVLVDFGAAWCPPCKKMEPVLRDLQARGKGSFRLLRIDGGAQEALMSALKVSTLPTFIMYKQGREVWRGSGLYTREELQRRL